MLDNFELKVNVKKLVGLDILKEAAEMTFLGSSNKLTLDKAYRCEHSLSYTQQFWIRIFDMPLYIATQFIRHSVGNVSFQLSCRDDRNGANVGLTTLLSELVDVAQNGGNTEAMISDIFSKVDRYTHVNLGMYINAQALINMSKKRYCGNASMESQVVFDLIADTVGDVDKDLANYLVPTCVYRNGLCPELKCCNFNKTSKYKSWQKRYNKLFK